MSTCRVRPADSPGYPIDAWFNVFVLHQNRVAHSQNAKNCIREGYLARFLDFVIWGHEHECISEPWVSLSLGYKACCFTSHTLDAYLCIQICNELMHTMFTTPALSLSFLSSSQLACPVPHSFLDFCNPLPKFCSLEASAPFQW